MTKKLVPILVIAVIVVGGISFYGGIKYSQYNEASGFLGLGSFQDLRNLSPKDHPQRFQQMGQNGGTAQRRMNGGQFGGGVVSGEILSKDDKSITIKLSDVRLSDEQGGSKIVFYSNTTEVGKFVDGMFADLEIGKIVTVNGLTNSDGSISAQTIQIRPASPVPGISPAAQ